MASTRVQDYIDKLGPAAVEIGARYGLDPKLILAQSALETGWGDSVAGNNYFGVKSHGQPGGQTVATHEEINGQMVPVNDSFRVYDGVTSSMEDYAKFLKDNPRYNDVFNQTDLQGQIDAVARAGYASDSKYQPKLTAIAGMINLPAGRTQLPPIAPAGGYDPGSPMPSMRRSQLALQPGRVMAPADPGSGWLSSLVDGAKGPLNSALGAIGNQTAPMMRSAQALAPGAVMQALSTLEGRSAIGHFLANKNVAKAPMMVSGAQPGGAQVMTTGGQLGTLMRAANGQVGGKMSQAFDNQYHGGQNMDVYRTNAAAVGGAGKLNASGIASAMQRGADLVRLAPGAIMRPGMGGSASSIGTTGSIKNNRIF